MKRLATAVLAATVGGGCQHADGHHHHRHFANADESSRLLDDPERDAWQHPDDVVRALDLTPTMTVADVGAGTGYFAVRLARAVPEGRVIATDIEPDMVRHVAERAQREHLANVTAVLATPASSGLAPSSVERILVVHVWHHLEARAAHARDLAAALRPGGKLVVVDFTRDARRGPPPEMRLAPETILGELAAAGLTAKVASLALPDQYVVEATRP